MEPDGDKHSFFPGPGVKRAARNVGILRRILCGNLEGSKIGAEQLAHFAPGLLRHDVHAGQRHSAQYGGKYPLCFSDKTFTFGYLCLILFKNIVIERRNANEENSHSRHQGVPALPKAKRQNIQASYSHLWMLPGGQKS